MILKKEKISADVVFDVEDFYTNKLKPRDSLIEIGSNGIITLVLDYSYYSRWNNLKKNEPEYTDYFKLDNHLTKVTKVWINDKTVVNKITERGVVSFVKLCVNAHNNCLFKVKSQTIQGSGMLLFEVEEA